MTAAPPVSGSAWSRRGWAIYLGWVVITLEGSALNLALPTIADALQADDGGISWVIDAYTLPLASLLLFGGVLGDRIGAARLFRIGAVGFAAASIACALSPSIELLIACRAAQGVFAALLLPMLLALVGTGFADSSQRSIAVNMMTLFGGAGMAVGPFLGGLLTDTVGWRAVFWITAPIAIIAAVLVGTDRHDRRSAKARFDLAGQVVGTVGLVVMVAGLIESGADVSWVVPSALIVLGLALLGLFVFVEHHSRHPMMPLSVFRTRGFGGAVGGGFAFQFGAYGLQFFLAIYLQTVWGLSALHGGLLLIAFAVGVVLSSAFLNPLLLSRGSRPLILIGAATAVIGTAALLAVDGESDWWLLVVAEFVIGGGTGLYSTGLNKAAGGALEAGTAGLASGVYNTARQIGQCIGIAIFGTLVALPDPETGFTVAIVLGAACGIAVAATAFRAPASGSPASPGSAAEHDVQGLVAA